MRSNSNNQNTAQNSVVKQHKTNKQQKKTGLSLSSSLWQFLFDNCCKSVNQEQEETLQVNSKKLYDFILIWNFNGGDIEGKAVIRDISGSKTFQQLFQNNKQLKYYLKSSALGGMLNEISVFITNNSLNRIIPYEGLQKCRIDSKAEQLGLIFNQEGSMINRINLIQSRD